jgi:hypothetical protein
MTETHGDIRINTDGLKGLAPLYHRFHNQTNPQPAFIEIDPAGRRVYADYSGEIGGGMPESVWHNRAYRFSVSPYVSGSALTQYMESDEFKALVGRICRGHKIRWDGNNLRGHLSYAGCEAIFEIERNLQDLDQDQVRDAYEWLYGHAETDTAADLGGGMIITAETTDERLAEIGKEIEDIAAYENVRLVDVDKGLRQIRQQVCERAADK